MNKDKLIVNNLHDHEKDNLGCSNPPTLKTNTAFIDSATSITVLGERAKCILAKLQEHAKQLGIPDGNTMMTTNTLQLMLKKLPEAEERHIEYQR